jgi:hypothetical protein
LESSVENVNEIVEERASQKFSSSRSASLLNNESERKGEVKKSRRKKININDEEVVSVIDLFVVV